MTDPIKSLRLLFEHHSSSPLAPSPIDMVQPMSSFAKDVGRMWKQESERQYPAVFRSSALGKHPFLLAWDHFHNNAPSYYNVKTYWKFMTGYAFELHMQIVMQQIGITYREQQYIEYQINDLTIGGTIDFVLEGKYILELKCVNSSRFKDWSSKGYVDDPKYTMQLAMYCTRLQLPGYFVVCNVDTGDIELFPFDHTKFENAILSKLGVLYFIKNCNEWWQTLEKIEPPAPPQRKDGTYYLPPFMYQSAGVPHPATCIYDYHHNDEGKYIVTGYNYPEAAKQWEPKL